MAKPETLAVVNEDFDGSAATIAKDEHRACERILSQRVFAVPYQTVDSFTIMQSSA